MSMRTLVSADEIDRTVCRLAAEIGPKEPVLLIPLLTGAMVFCSDLLKHLTCPALVKPMIVRRLEVGTMAQVEYLMPITRKEWISHSVWLVDDSIFRGVSLAQAHACVSRELLKHNLGRKIHSVALFRKPYRARVFEPTLIGMDISQGFAFGYGSDASGHFRGLSELRA